MEGSPESAVRGLKKTTVSATTANGSWIRITGADFAINFYNLSETLLALRSAFELKVKQRPWLISTTDTPATNTLGVVFVLAKNANYMVPLSPGRGVCAWTPCIIRDRLFSTAHEK